MTILKSLRITPLVPAVILGFTVGSVEAQICSYGSAGLSKSFLGATVSSMTGGAVTHSLPVDPPPAFSKLFAPDLITVYGTSTLTFTIDNSAGADPTAVLSFADSLPAGLIVATPANAATTCTGGSLTASAGSGTITYAGGTADARSVCTVSVDIAPTFSGVFANVSGPLTSVLGSSGTATDTLTVEGPPAFRKLFAPGSINAGDTSRLTFTIDNSGNNVPASLVSFVDILPAGLFIATPANAATTCTGGAFTAFDGSGVIAYTSGTVPTGTSCTLAADITGTTAGTFVNTTGALTSSAGNSGTATDTLNVIPVWTLGVSTTGTGTGTVTSAPAGIDCGTDCAELYANDTIVALTANPALRSFFMGWSGDDDCTDGTVTMTREKSCTATFMPMGDWNVDGAPDMAWRNPNTGKNALLYLNTNAKAGIDFIVSAPTDWEMAGAADLNTDGLMDLIFRNTVTGLHIVAHFDGKDYLGFKVLPFRKAPWRLCGTADLNNDNRADLFWTNTATGENEVVYLSGEVEIGMDTLPKAPAPWRVVAVDDFNGDDMPDLVARNTVTGRLGVGFLEGTNLNGVGILPTAPLTQEVLGTMDLNLDGKPDLVLRDPATGKNEAWYMNGTKRIGSPLKLPTAPPPWYGITGYK